MSTPNYPPPPGWPPQPPPQPQGLSYGRAMVFAGIAFVVGLIFGAPIGNGDSSTSTASAAAQPTTTRAQAAAPRTTTTAAPAPAVPAGPRTSFGDGTWIVGEDIEPGTYRSNGAQEGLFELCSYSRLKDPSSDSDRLSWGTANANDPIVIRIRPSDGAFTATGCETFTKAD